jgi:BNR/Asp-box repeat
MTMTEVRPQNLGRRLGRRLITFAGACLVLGVGLTGVSVDGTASAATTGARPVPKGVSGAAGVACFRGSHCVLVGSAVGTGALVDIPAAAYSLDSGKTWSGNRIHGGPNQPESVACSSPLVCVGVGQNHTASNGGETWVPGVLRTTNGGATWASQTLAATQGFLGGISCPSLSRCVAVGMALGATGTVAPLEYYSRNGGVTWTAGGVSNTFNQISTVSCPNATRCLALGVTQTGANVSIVSTDGGASWSQGGTPPGTGELDSVSCFSIRDCVAVGNNANLNSPDSLQDVRARELITADGGMSWKPGVLPKGVSFLNAVACTSAGSCVAVGSGELGSTAPPIAIHSRDRGHTWFKGKMADKHAGGLDGVTCASAARCVAVGATGVPGKQDAHSTALVSTTSDGGRSWS